MIPVMLKQPILLQTIQHSSLHTPNSSQAQELNWAVFCIISQFLWNISFHDHYYRDHDN